MGGVDMNFDVKVVDDDDDKKSLASDSTANSS